MIINYNVSGSDRKQLVAAIAQHTGEKAKYLGAPGFAYQVGGFCCKSCTALLYQYFLRPSI